MYKVHHDLGIVYYRKGDYSKAIETYKKALSLDNGDYKVYYDLATAYTAIQDHENAIENYTRALMLKEDDIYTMNSLALAYVANNNFELAQELAEKIQTTNPTMANNIFKQINNRKD